MAGWRLKLGALSEVNVIRYDLAANSSTALLSGLNGAVLALAGSSSTLYIGGNFTSVTGVSGAGAAAVYSSSVWAPLGGDVTGAVNALALSGSSLYVGANTELCYSELDLGAELS